MTFSTDIASHALYRRAALGLTCSLVTAASLAALHSWAASEDLSGGATNDPTRLPAVIVTAQKVSTELESLPLSVTPVTAENIRDADITWMKQAAQYSPNTFFNEFSARKLSNPYFRGVGSSPNNPGVTTYIDGVPQLNANSSSIELIGVDQIEFVRGAQSTLFGRNSIGGVININSTRPSPVWTSEVTGEYGNYDYRDARVTASGPIAEGKLFAGVGLGYSARDGYTKNDVTGHSLDDRDAFFGKGQLLWTPSDQWELRLIFSGERAQDGDYALGDLASIRANPHHVSHDFEGYTDRDIIAPTLIATRKGERVDFSSISGLVWWRTEDATDLDYTALPAVTRKNEEKDFQFTQEFRFATGKDAPIVLSDALEMKWQGGLAVFTQNYDQDAVNEVQPPFSQLPFALQTRSQAELNDVGVGVYGQATLTAWEKLDFTAGVRGDYENKEADLRNSYSPPILPGSRLDTSDDFTRFTPQFQLAYHLSGQHLVYASVSEGYKAGGFNATSPQGSESYGEETTWSYEIGTKSRFLEDRLLVNLAFFYINWDDLQLNLPTGAPAQYYIANAGGADSKGVELEIKARPIAGWDVFASAGYTDARFLSGAHAGHTDPLGGDSVVDVGGRHLIYTPEFTVNGGMQYSYAVCTHATVYARAEVTTYGDFYYNPLNTAGQGTFSLADFRAGVRGKNWFAEGWVRNAFDEKYVPIAFEFPNGAFGGSGFVGESGAPVTYGLRVGLLF
jgi:iron complex outermembrane receptor protein